MATTKQSTPKRPRAAKSAATAKPATARKPRATRRASAPEPKRGLFGYALGAASIAAGALLTVFVAREVRKRTPGSAEHVPTDLLGDTRPAPTDRAPDAFRPDPTAPVPASEREGLRPATGPAPTLVTPALATAAE